MKLVRNGVYNIPITFPAGFPRRFSWLSREAALEQSARVSGWPERRLRKQPTIGQLKTKDASWDPHSKGNNFHSIRISAKIAPTPKVLDKGS